MAKLSPVGSKALARGGICSLTVYQRFHFYPQSMEDMSDPSTRHLFYLQLRKDLLEDRLSCHEETGLHLGALALQAEYGDCMPEVCTVVAL